MQNAIATYKTEAGIATGSAMALGATQTPEEVVPILQMHLWNLFGYSWALGDVAALAGAFGIFYVASSSLIKWLAGKFE